MTNYDKINYFPLVIPHIDKIGYRPIILMIIFQSKYK